LAASDTRERNSSGNLGSNKMRQNVLLAEVVGLHNIHESRFDPVASEEGWLAPV